MNQPGREIPNNVDLADNPRLQRALQHWLPRYHSWWHDMGPDGFQDHHEIYLRTAVSADSKGWADYRYVKLPEYRWGIFLASKDEKRTIGFGDLLGEPVWQKVPGEFRNSLRNLIVTQGDTEPASVEQQRRLGKNCPSMYDMRNLFQVNVEEGRHLWAMVYLLHSFFGSDGRNEAEELLERRSGDDDKPRILETFNEPINNWLDYFMFTMFTDRDGKAQLKALSESAFDPLARTTRFMLTEEAFHLSVGDTGIQRVVERTAELMREMRGGSEDVRTVGGIDLPTIQKYVNLWFSTSLDLFGSEISSNAANYFAQGLKGRWDEPTYNDHMALDDVYRMETYEDDKPETLEVPMRKAMNAVLRDRYTTDSELGLKHWNNVLTRYGMSDRLRLPHYRFNRIIGVYSQQRHDVDGQAISEQQWAQEKDTWLPTDADRDYVESLMSEPVTEPGKIANWIVPPKRGIDGKSWSYEYVRTEP